MPCEQIGFPVFSQEKISFVNLRCRSVTKFPPTSPARCEQTEEGLRGETVFAKDEGRMHTKGRGKKSTLKSQTNKTGLARRWLGNGKMASRTLEMPLALTKVESLIRASSLMMSEKRENTSLKNLRLYGETLPDVEISVTS